MDWQQPVALAVVAFTGYFFVRHEIRRRRKSRSRACGSDCGCESEEGWKMEDGKLRIEDDGRGTP